MSTSTPPPNRCNNSTEQCPDTRLPHSSVMVDLTELVEKYAQLVPFRMRVVNGFMAADNTKDPSFLVDEIYSVHLVKETKVVKVSSTNGVYSIPINSLAKVGLIHEENEVTVFKTVEDLMSAEPLPQVVAVQNDYISPSQKISLKKDEVLAIKDVSKSRIGGSIKVMLKVFSFLSRETFVLPEELEVKFTTDPYYTQLYLTDMVDHIAMPCLAQVFPTCNSSLTSLLTSMKITLQSQETQRSVIVSLFRDNPTSKKCNLTNFINVSTSININVSIIQTNDADGIYEHIMKKSKDLLQDYNPTKISACVDSGTDAAYMTQAQLLAEVRREKEKMTLAKFAPRHYQSVLFGGAQEKLERTCQTRSLSTSSKRPQSTTKGDSRTSVNVALSGQKHSIPPPPLPPKMKKKPTPLAPKEKLPLPSPQVIAKQRDNIYKELLQYNASSVTNYETITKEQLCRNTFAEKINPKQQQQHPLEAKSSPTPTSRVEYLPKSLHREVELLPKAFKEEMKIPVILLIKEVQESIERISKQMDEVFIRQSYFEAELNALRATCGISNGHTQEVPMVHIGMSSAQVLGVLDAIGLPQYKEAFAREVIDGELFTILDDETLANELAVASRIHRVRILRLTK